MVLKEKMKCFKTALKYKKTQGEKQISYFKFYTKMYLHLNKLPIAVYYYVWIDSK